MEVIENNLYGVMAEFDTPNELVNAARQVRDAGYTKTDGHSPFPIHEMDDALGVKRSILPYLVFAGGITGTCVGIAMQVFMAAIDYPINVGGRPYISIPSFIPVSYELTILMAAFTAVFGMILLNGLPKPYHPVFNVERFVLASREKFFITIEAEDEKFDRDKTTSFLRSIGAKEVFDVEE